MTVWEQEPSDAPTPLFAGREVPQRERDRPLGTGAPADRADRLASRDHTEIEPIDVGVWMRLCFDASLVRIMA